MDALCLKAGIHGIPPPITVAGGPVLDVRASHLSASAVGRSSSSSSAAAGPGNSISVEKPVKRNLPWGFSFKYPLRSLWPGGVKNRYDAIALDDAVLVEEKEDVKEEEKVDTVGRDRDGSWVFKILHVRSLWREEDQSGGGGVVGEELEVNVEDEDEDDERKGECGGDGGCDVCAVNDDGVDSDDDDEKIEFDKDSFSKLLRRVSLAEARLYAQMSYLGNLAYCIPQIKSGNLLRNHGLRFVTSSIEKREQALLAEKEKTLAEEKENVEKQSEAQENGDAKPKDQEKVDDASAKDQLSKEKVSEVQEIEERMHERAAQEDTNSTRDMISASATYRIAASAASYLRSHTMSILPFKSSSSTSDEDFSKRTCRSIDDEDKMKEEVASLMATTDSVTAVVAAKEEVKQAVADDLNSTRTSPCEWFICDDDQSATRFFVIQGSESLASWQANLLFEPIQFEGLDVLVHRGIYEAAKGIYEQMLPEVHSHLKSHGDRATLRFTGHSLGGSLSLLVNLMLLIRGEVPAASLLPVITFGAPSIMCGGDRLLSELGLPRSHVQAITMHRDIVPRAFSCNYPNHVAEFLKAVNSNFRSLPCLNNQKLLYAPMGELLILQPDEKFSPSHHLLPSGSGLYLLSYPAPDASDAEKRLRAAKAVFLNSPHPLEILSDRAAYGSEGTIQRDHDMNSYLKSVRNVIRQELNLMRKAKREHRRRVWWPLVASRGVNGGIIVGRPVGSTNMGQGQVNFAGVIQSGKESLKRFSRLVASQHMHLLVVLLLPARLLILGTAVSQV